MNMIRKAAVPTMFLLLLIFAGWVITANVTSSAYTSTYRAENQSELAEKLNEVIKTHANLHSFSGTVLVSRGDEILFQEGYGYARRYWGQAQNTPSTRYLIGSMTKTYTAVAILQLAEQGLLRLDDPVTRFYPQAAGWEQVTLHHLLNHTSGIRNYWETPQDQARYFLGHTSPEAIIAAYQDQPLLFAPGAQFDYSNTNYMILTGIIEKVSGRPYIDYLKTNILGPAGLTNTGYEEFSSSIDNLAAGYCAGMRIEVVGFNLSNFYGAGGMYTTAQDMYRFTRALDLRKLVNEENQAHIRDNISYGYGMMQYDDPLLGSTYHISGGGPGISTAMFFLADHDLTLVILSNNQEFDYEPLAADLFRAYQGQSQ